MPYYYLLATSVHASIDTGDWLHASGQEGGMQKIDKLGCSQVSDALPDATSKVNLCMTCKVILHAHRSAEALLIARSTGHEISKCPESVPA
eukprot:6177447-Pleurochrysis_carterae.AAC.3